MRRVRFEVPAEELDAVLDAVMPLLPAGIREAPAGPDRIEVTTVGAAGRMPGRAALESAAGRELQAFAEDDVPADWRLRRARTDVLIAGRVVLRGPGDPAPGPGVMDVVLMQESLAFGTGSHPTTRMCVELLLDLEPRGGFADVGCGLGTLAIVAARLGFAPVVALDREPAAIEQAVQNAARNGVDVDCVLVDAEGQAAPAQRTLAVNAPPAVNLHVAQTLTDATGQVIVSGAAGPEMEPVLKAYAAAGLTPTGRLADPDQVWSAVLLTRG